jgi:blue copper oxidase
MISKKQKNTLVAIILLMATNASFAQNPLLIPDTLSGTTFNLSVQQGTSVFFDGYNTPTYGYNGSFLGPTLFINKQDSITLNVTNNLPVATTVHWHGFHVAPSNDGGPHQVISPGATWSPSFKMRNNASTYWYHPHGEGKTEIQVSKGLAGLIIVRDSLEASYTLPRKYGIDDFPIILSTRSFDVLYQIATATHSDSVVMINGTLNPYLTVPKQVVRLRLLNGSADRTYNLGLSDDSPFYLIATDGGMLSQPFATTRLRMSPGERAEILINFDTYDIAQQLYLKSYASELQKGIIGADSVGTSTLIIGEEYYTNLLNGSDFNLLRFDVTTTTANPVTTIPANFAPIIPMDTLDVNTHRHLHFSPDTLLFGAQAYVDGPFFINNEAFNINNTNIITHINDKEIWTLTNTTLVAHPFHIHDIQFFVLDINGNPPPPQYSGLKDVILVKPQDTVRFITKFETFADETVPYMYHCHLLHHEDEGMMGSFLVKPNAIGINQLPPNNGIKVYPNPLNAQQTLTIQSENNINNIAVFDVLGRQISTQKTSGKQITLVMPTDKGVYMLQIKTDQTTLSQKIVVAY